ncbi:MAG: P-loop NTPase [bacterium]|nr:P-loop NTPase [bacterium]
MKRYRDIAGDGGSNILQQVAAQRERVDARLSQIGRVVAVLSGKGGVGKSTLTANLAAAWALQGLAVGVLDADLNGPSMATMLGVRRQTFHLTPEGVAPAVGPLDIRVMSMDGFLPSDGTPVTWDGPSRGTFIWRGTMEMSVLREFVSDTAWGPLDLLVVDLPPGNERLPHLTDIIPTLAGVVVVTIPTEVSQLVVNKTLTVAKTTGVPILGLVENMAGYVCSSCNAVGGLFEGGEVSALAVAHGVPFLGSTPFDGRIARQSDGGVPFVIEHGETPAGRAILAIAESLRSVLGLTSTDSP